MDVIVTPGEFSFTERFNVSEPPQKECLNIIFIYLEKNKICLRENHQSE